MFISISSRRYFLEAGRTAARNYALSLPAPASNADKMLAMRAAKFSHSSQHPDCSTEFCILAINATKGGHDTDVLSAFGDAINKSGRSR